MKRAFGSFVDCVQDGVMSACGAFDTASLERIYESLELRGEKYFDQDGNVVGITQDEHWRIHVRRVLFVSNRFGVAKPDHSEDLEFYVVEKKLDWYMYPSKFYTGSNPITEDIGRMESQGRSLQSDACGAISIPSCTEDDFAENNARSDKHSSTSNSSSGTDALQGAAAHETEEQLPTTRSSPSDSESTKNATMADRNSSTSGFCLEEGDGLRTYENIETTRAELKPEEHIQENDVQEPSQPISYKTELTHHTLCSNLELGSFPGSFPF
ncbi:hypothetical protein FGB62_64g132 [Gracilaria domingensis]|nr:hypothetical protein FGB62_64g132 [Gracilaria domingensis]